MTNFAEYWVCCAWACVTQTAATRSDARKTDLMLHLPLYNPPTHPMLIHTGTLDTSKRYLYPVGAVKGKIRPNRGPVPGRWFLRRPPGDRIPSPGGSFRPISRGP